MKKLAVSQSNYIPWKGYFDMIAAVDKFVILDDVQFTKNDWRNRNIIKTPLGPSWLSIPVGKKINRKIFEVRLEVSWQEKHWKLIEDNYKKAKYFKDISHWLKPLYLDQEYLSLSEVNFHFINAICSYLRIKTKIYDSRDFTLVDGRSERLIDLCKQLGVAQYFSGPSAKDYIDQELFNESNINICWMNYNDYPIYPQLWGDFEHSLSILDLLFNCGEKSFEYMLHTQS